jgi:hypothetical protein
MRDKTRRLTALATAAFVLAACAPQPAAAPPAIPTPLAVATLAPFELHQGDLADRAASAALAQRLPLLAEREAQLKAALTQNPPIVLLNAGLDETAKRAQDMAINDARFTEYARNPQTREPLRNEIFGVYAARASDITPATEACRQATCYRVEMYNAAYNLTTVAVVDVTNNKVLAVTQLPDTQPEIPEQLKTLATQIAVNSPEVAGALGFKPGEEQALMANTKSSLNGTRCERSRHLCVAPTFVQGDRALWAIVDLTDNALVGVRWTNLGSRTARVTEQRLEDEVISAKYCEQDTPVERGGWKLDFILTSSDGLRVSNVAFEGKPVLRSAKVVDWHVSYSQREGFGYSDAVGCPTFSSAAVIPYDEPVIEDILQDGQAMGWSLTQEFRSQGWPLPCNYSYRQRYEFYGDGRYRVAVASIGSGCGGDGMYRPVLRIDPAGDDLTFSEWTGSGWEDWATEQWQIFTPDTPLTPEGFQYRYLNAAGAGFYLEPGRGQFGDGGRGDNAFVYVTRRHPDRDEGESDMLTIGPCCNPDFKQGPEKFIDAAPESIQNAPITIWYVSQLKNDDTPGREYCWATAVLEDGVFVPKAWPCHAGPMFVPIKSP